MLRTSALLISILLAAGACSDDDDAPKFDARYPDTAVITPDGGDDIDAAAAIDAAMTAADASAIDAVATTTDAAAADAPMSMADASAADAPMSMPDAGPPDATPPDAEPPDAEAPDAMVMFDARPPSFGDNFDFEDWSASDPPPNYTKTPTTLWTVGEESTTVGSGSRAAVVNWTTTANRDLYHGSTYTVANAVRHTFQAWFYDNDSGGRARPVIRVNGGNSFPGAGGYSADSTSWQVRSHNFTPAVGDSFEVFVRFYDVGGAPVDATVYTDDWAVTEQVTWVVDGTADTAASALASGGGLDVSAGFNDDTELYVQHSVVSGSDRFLFVWVGGPDASATVAAPWNKAGTVAAPVAGGALFVLAQEESNGFCEWRRWDTTGTTWQVLSGGSCMSGGDIEGVVTAAELGFTANTLPRTISIASVSYGTNDADPLTSSTQLPASTNSDGDVDATEVTSRHRFEILAGKVY